MPPCSRPRVQPDTCRPLLPTSEKSKSENISAAERVEIEHACEQLVYAYSRALDLGDLSGAADKPPLLSNGPIFFGEFKDRFVREHGVWKFQERLGSIQMKFAGP
jgi:hypothetical protein